MRVLNVGAARRLSAVASLCMVRLVVSSCGMVTITPKNAGEPTAGTLTGLPSPAEMAGARGSAAGRSVFARRPLRRCGYGRCRPALDCERERTNQRQGAERQRTGKQTNTSPAGCSAAPRGSRASGCAGSSRVHRGWVAHRLVCACCGCVRALLGRCVPCVLIHHKWLCKVTAASQCPLGCSAVAVGLVYVLF